jgi:hypothetical protein
LIGVLVVLTIFHVRGRFPPLITPWLQLAWAIVVLMPFLMMFRGVFTVMYFYLVIIPVSLAILEIIRHIRVIGAGRWQAGVLILVMALNCVGGLPARLYSSIREWNFRDPERKREFIREYLHPGDAVISEFAFYFELKDSVKFVGSPQYLWIIPPDEAVQVNVALIDWNPNQGDHLGSGLLGPGWRKVAVFPTQDMLANLRHPSVYRTYTLYRRDLP